MELPRKRQRNTTVQIRLGAFSKNMCFFFKYFHLHFGPGLFHPLRMCGRLNLAKVDQMKVIPISRKKTFIYKLGPLVTRFTRDLVKWPLTWAQLGSQIDLSSCGNDGRYKAGPKNIAVSCNLLGFFRVGRQEKKISYQKKFTSHSWLTLGIVSFI